MIDKPFIRIVLEMSCKTLKVHKVTLTSVNSGSSGLTTDPLKLVLSCLVDILIYVSIIVFIGYSDWAMGRNRTTKDSVHTRNSLKAAALLLCYSPPVMHRITCRYPFIYFMLTHCIVIFIFQASRNIMVIIFMQ